MNYSRDEVIQYAREEDVKFIRLAFCDVFGKQKNISIMPQELPRAFEYGVRIDGSAVAGFGEGVRGDLLLHPEPETLSPLPWRPEHGRVVQMFSALAYPDGEPFERDTRGLLKKAVREAEEKGRAFTFGAGQEFYLFLLDENGKPTKVPYDEAGYLDIAPEDRGENIRREVCLTLEKMGIRPESSHHGEGPGQNKIDLGPRGPLAAADNAQTLQRVVKTVAHRSGLWADFSPKPLAGGPGNGFPIRLSPEPFDGEGTFSHMTAGVLGNLRAMTVFLDPSEDSYQRLGKGIALQPAEGRSRLMGFPAAPGGARRMELRSPDPGANPYLAFALLLYAALEGIEKQLPLPGPEAGGLHTALHLGELPESREEARKAACESGFIRARIPPKIMAAYCGK